LKHGHVDLHQNLTVIDAHNYKIHNIRSTPLPQSISFDYWYVKATIKDVEREIIQTCKELLKESLGSEEYEKSMKGLEHARQLFCEIEKAGESRRFEIHDSKGVLPFEKYRRIVKDAIFVCTK